MEKNVIVTLNSDVKVLKDSEKLHAELRDSVVFDNYGNPKIDELLKSQIKERHSFVFKDGNKYKGLLINENTVKIFLNADKTDSIELDIDNHIIHSFEQDNNLPPEYSHYYDGCWAVCLKNYATQGKTETLEVYKLYQLSEIKYNEKTKKVTAYVTGSKYKWNVSRFRVVNTEFLAQEDKDKNEFSMKIIKCSVRKFLKDNDIYQKFSKMLDEKGLSKKDIWTRIQDFKNNKTPL